MKIFNKLVFTSFIGYVIAEGNNYTGDCKEIYEYLRDLNYKYELNLQNCVVNDTGNVTDL